MAVSPEEVRRVAALARLRLDPGAVEALAADLSSVLRHVDALAAVEGGEAPGPAVAPGPPGVDSGLRPDEPGADPLARPPVDFAPELLDGLFTLPRVPSHPGAAAPDDADPGGGAGNPDESRPS
ncbi:MAG: aspartyl/glutamyl-tRNA amidotransferase subunit C [Gemmatimonadota bacterium]